MTPRSTQNIGETARPAVQIEKLVYGGDGLARLDGQVALIPFVLPGERVEMAGGVVKGGVLRSAAARISEFSPHRVAPKCEYFGSCGGCHYQHADYGFQLEQKRAILRETLQRLGGIRYEDEIHMVSGEPWQYRNRVQLHFEHQKMGFRRAESHELCEISHCEISSPLINEVIAKLSWAIRQPEWPGFLRSLEVFTNETDVQFQVLETDRPVAARFFIWCASFLPSLAPSEIYYPAAEFTFRVSRGSFFQVNRFLTDALVGEVLSEVEGNSAIDLYAGVGLFSIPLTKRFRSVEAVERGGTAQRDLDFNVTKAEVEVNTTRVTTEEFLGQLVTPPDLILADPPRAGLGREAASELIRLLPSQIKIISCDAATLARDLRVLQPNYQINRLTLVDLFPHTYHFETVVHLHRI